MKKVLKLAWGIITKPVPTFERIKKEKPFADGLLVFFFTYSLLILSSFIFEPEPILKEFDFFIKFHPLWQALIVTAGLLILSFLALLLGAGIINLIARLFRGKGAFKSLLNCALFISAVYYLIVFPLNVLFTALKLETAASIIFVAVSLWALILFITAIKTIYNFSLLRSISTYLCYLLTVVLTVVLILAVPLGIIGLTYFRFTKSADKLLADIEYDRKTHGGSEYFALDDKYRDLKNSFWEKNVVYSKEEYKKALVDHSKFVEEYPDSKWADDVRSDIGEIYWEGLKDSEKAIEEYQGIIRDYPGSYNAASAQYAIATISGDLEDYDRALTAYRKVITDYPKSSLASLAQNVIGNIYKHDFEDISKAIEEYRKVVKNYPRSDQADYVQYEIGFLYQCELKDYDQAIKEYRKLIKNYPNSTWAPLAQMFIGDIYYRKLNQKEQAIKAYQQVIKRYPKSEEVKEAQDRINSLKAEDN